MYFPFAITSVNSGRFTTGSVQVSEVEVDTRLGRVVVRRSWTGLAAGRLVVPRLARSQVLGGVLMGLGYTLHEERRRDPNTGVVLTRGFEDHRIPSPADLPEMHLHFVEQPGSARGGAVGIAELPVVAVPASIGNAVFHATGVRFRELPLRPWTVLEGLAP
jgi:xanthine dehydrogenase YagR molybdenum-binding subunit